MTIFIRERISWVSHAQAGFSGIKLQWRQVSFLPVVRLHSSGMSCQSVKWLGSTFGLCNKLIAKFPSIRPVCWAGDRFGRHTCTIGIRDSAGQTRHKSWDLWCRWVMGLLRVLSRFLLSFLVILALYGLFISTVGRVLRTVFPSLSVYIVCVPNVIDSFLSASSFLRFSHPTIHHVDR